MKTGVAVLAFAGVLLAVPAAAGADPGCPTGYTPDGDGCTARLTAVSADSTAGTLTGFPLGGMTPITIFGEPGFYLPSNGFGSAPPPLVTQWDAVIAGVGATSPADPGWYGEGKARAFLPRQLNDIATRLPSGSVVIHGVPDPMDPHLFTLRSIQPVA